MDDVIFQLKLSAMDLAVIYSFARQKKISVNEWIMQAILEKIEREQVAQQIQMIQQATAQGEKK